MPKVIPPVQDLVDSNIANIENRLNQTTPPLARAFNRVYAIAISFVQKGLYLFATDKAKQALAISADEEGLTVLGEEFTVPRKLAEATILVITLPGSSGIIIPATVSFIGDANGVRYFPDSSATITGGVATINVTAEDAGVVGNLNNGDTLQIDTQVAGAETTAIVQSTSNVGADEELLETWRGRVLFAIRTVSGGSNATDNKKWAEEVAGVSRAFPYSGRPPLEFPSESPSVSPSSSPSTSSSPSFSVSPSLSPSTSPSFSVSPSESPSASPSASVSPSLSPSTSPSVSPSVTPSTSPSSSESPSVSPSSSPSPSPSPGVSAASFPGDRTVYIRADTSIDGDGIPPTSLLDEVRSSINTDPVTGKSRNVLGIIDDTLFVKPIRRTVFDVTVNGLDVPASSETEVKSDIDDALTEYFVSLFNFIEGVDVIQDKNDIITKLTVGTIVQDIMEAHGVTSEDVRVKESGGGFFLTRQLLQGELAKFGSTTYL